MRPIYLICALTMGVIPQMGTAQQKPKAAIKPVVDKRPLTEDEKALHVLNRLGFGPRPGDVDRVKKMGIKAYVQEQLNPDKLKDEAVEAKTGSFEMIKLSGTEIAEMERNVQMSNAQLLRIQAMMAQRGATGGADAIQGAVTQAQTGTTAPPAQQARGALEIYRNATPEERKTLDEGRMAREKVNSAGAQLVMNKIIRAAESEKQLYEMMVDFWSNHFNIDATKVRASKVVDEHLAIRPHAMGKFRDLLNASATSAAMMIYLDNAVSVAASNTPDRPNALQITFEQLMRGVERGLPQARQMYARLQERAKAEGISEEEAYKRFQTAVRPGQRPPRPGLNENYARELLELHTLGVDGGYTQKDVTEVARCLTGWGVKGGRYSGEFEFHPNQHDRTEKTVLGKTIPAGGGIEDGKMVLEMLVNHPSTMRYVSAKLCRRFVSDEPPVSLVNKCVETWKRTDGDIKLILSTIFESPEFFSRAAYKSKIKSPFEFVISSVRATGATVITASREANGPGAGFRPVGAAINVFAANGNGQTNTRLLSGQIGSLGQPLFNYGFPTGYPEESTKWVSAGALIGRINFALALVGGRINDVDLTGAFATDAGLEGRPLTEQINSISRVLLGHEPAAATRATLLKQLQAETGGAMAADPRKVASLLLGSPDFQRR